MLVKISYKKRKNTLNYVYKQRISITQSLFENLVSIVNYSIQNNPKYKELTPLDIMSYGLKEIAITKDHLEIIKNELEAHSLRKINIDIPTALFIRERM